VSTPEERAREVIDAKLAESGWVVQSRDAVNLTADPGAIVREFPLQGGHGYADYMLFVDRRPAAALDDKPDSDRVRSDEIQTQLAFLVDGTKNKPQTT